jgi:hypothetical protein
MEVWREWKEMVDYLRVDRSQEVCRGLRGNSRLEELWPRFAYIDVCACVDVCVCVCMRKRKRGGERQRKREQCNSTERALKNR